MKHTTLLITLLLATACSSGSTPSALPTAQATVTQVPTASPTPSATPSPTARPTPTPTISPTPFESPAPLGQPNCTAAAVSITDADTLATPQHKSEIYVLRTTGSPCQLQGYPTVTLLDGSGKPLAVTVIHGGQGLPKEQETAYTLSKSTSLSFEVATARAGTCVDATAIQVTLPHTTKVTQVTTDVRVCGSSVGLSPIHRLGDDE